MRCSFPRTDFLMRITDIKFYTVPVDFRTWVLVKVETSEDGLFGWGEATVEWKARSVLASLEELRELAIGEDPRRIRHLTRKLVKRHYWDPGVVAMSAISGIEVACWDIFGKSVGRPVVDLLGGAVRDRVPVYTHLGYGSSEDVYERSMSPAVLDTLERIIEQGYHAVKVVNVPFHNQFIFAKARNAFFELLENVLDVCSGRIDVALDVHGRCGSVASAETLLGFLQGKNLLFVEELLRPSSPEVFASLAAKYDVRLATGERLVDIADFVDLARLNAVAVLQPDIAHCGGLLAASQIAAIADGFRLSVAPHNPLGVVASTAGLHYALATPNFLVQEEMSAHFAAAKDFIGHPIRFENGYWTLEPGVGLGLEIDEAFLQKLSGRNEPLLTQTAVDADGSVVDW
jgi:galactonate dehydratase